MNLLTLSALHGCLHGHEFGNILPTTVATTTFTIFVPNGNGSHLVSFGLRMPAEKKTRKKMIIKNGAVTLHLAPSYLRSNEKKTLLVFCMPDNYAPTQKKNERTNRSDMQLLPN